MIETTPPTLQFNKRARVTLENMESQGSSACKREIGKRRLMIRIHYAVLD